MYLILRLVNSYQYSGLCIPYQQRQESEKGQIVHFHTSQSKQMNICIHSRFDLRTLDANGPEDEEGIRRATELVHSMIEQEIKGGIASNRIVIGGFSQGGALALYSALLFPKPLAGVIALSCWLPLHKQFPAVSMCWWLKCIVNSLHSCADSSKVLGVCC
jgi:predicted esterase